MQKDEVLFDLLSERQEGKVDFANLDITGQRRNRPKIRGKQDSLDVWAMDTETYTRGKHKGDVFCMADDEGNYIWKPSLYEMLKFLVLPSHLSKTGFCFNLRFDAEGVLKKVDESILVNMKLDPKQKSVKLNFGGGRGKKKTGRQFILQYRGSKGFKIIEGKHLTRLSDISPFYPGLGLDKASQIFLGEKKQAIGKFDFDPESVELRKDEILRYCKKDAELTAKLGRLAKNQSEDKGVYARDYPSPASLGERYICQNSDYIAMVHPAKPNESHPCLDKLEFKGTYSNPIEYAWLSFGGGWFEICKRGYFPKLYKYDINSAFPAVAKTLVNIDPDFGRDWIYQKGKIPRNKMVKYGFIKAQVHIKENIYLSPIPYHVRNEGAPLVIYPTGDFLTYLTLKEFDFVNTNLGKAKIIDGFFLITDPKTPEVIYNPIGKLYKLKQALKPLKDKDAIAGVNYQLTKLWLNSAGYGKFIQKTPYMKVLKSGEVVKRWKTGNMFNPVWASIITSEVRLKIARAILGKEHIVVMIMTDGILTTEPLNLPLGDRLGQWTEVILKDVVVVKSGVYQAKGKNPETKTRGFKATFGTLKNPETDLFNYFKNNPNIDHIVAEYQRPLTLNECLPYSGRKKGLNKDRVNEFITEKKRFYLIDDKRDWNNPNLKGKDFLNYNVVDSIPRNETGILDPYEIEDLLSYGLEEPESLRKEVMREGGIKVTDSIKDFGKPSDIPLCCRRKAGIPFDEMADVLHITENELWEGLV